MTRRPALRTGGLSEGLMIPIWISREGPIPIREQIATQLILGVMSRDLAPGERLPSIRALARKLSIHPNTVSTIYQDLESRGWLENRRGSGVYVRAVPAFKRAADELLARYISAARAEGLGPGEIRAAVEHALSTNRPTCILVVDPDPDLREIMEAEIRLAGLQVRSSATATDCDGAIVAVIPARERLLDSLPAGTESVVLRLSSVAKSLRGQTRPSSETIMAVASRSAVLRERCRSVLIAAGVAEDALTIVNSGHEGWQDRVLAADLQIADLVTAGRLPKSPKVRTFRVLAESSIDDLAAAVAKG